MSKPNWFTKFWYTGYDGTEHWVVIGPKQCHDGSFRSKRESDVIAAAPEMLHSLKYLVCLLDERETMQKYLCPVEIDARSDARAVIAKAEGKS